MENEFMDDLDYSNKVEHEAHENEFINDCIRDDKAVKEITREEERKCINSKVCSFCGGEVSVTQCSPDGSSWAIECLKCGYLYDED